MRKTCRRCGEVDYLAVKCGRKRTFAAVVAEKRSQEKSRVTAQPTESVPKSQEEVKPNTKSQDKENPILKPQARKDKIPQRAEKKQTGQTIGVEVQTIPKDTVTLTRGWLGGKLEKGVMVPIEMAEQGCILPDREGLKEIAALYWIAIFETDGRLTFMQSKMADATNEYVTIGKETVLKAFDTVGTRSRKRN